MLTLRADPWAFATDGTSVDLAIPADAASRLASILQPKSGVYSIPEVPGLVIDVEQTIVRDKDGNETERVG